MVFGLFSKEKALQRTIERATNKLAQQPDRWGAMEKLAEDGSEEALLGLCKRFAITATKSTEDEQEKTWAVDALVAKGDLALPALRRYMQNSTELSFALKVLERLDDKPRTLKIVDEILAIEKPGYTRDAERRIDLIRWLAEWKALSSEEAVARLTPYLNDFDENVRFAVIDGLAIHDLALSAPHLIGALLRPEEESGRIKRHIGEVLAEHKLPLGDQAKAIEPHLVGTLSTFWIKNGVLMAR